MNPLLEREIRNLHSGLTIFNHQRKVHGYSPIIWSQYLQQCFPFFSTCRDPRDFERFGLLPLSSPANFESKDSPLPYLPNCVSMDSHIS